MSLWRMILAGLIGGVVVFLWSFVSHTQLPTAHAGMKPIPDEDAMLEVLQGALKDHAAYVFPGMPFDHPTQEEQEKWAAAYKAGPRGMIIFDPTGDAAMSPKMLGTEFISGVIAAMVAAIISSAMYAGYFARVLMIMLMGVFAWLAIDVSYWSWHRIPDGMTMTGLIDQGAGWLFAGFPIAAIAKPRISCNCGPECGCGPGCQCGKA